MRQVTGEGEAKGEEVEGMEETRGKRWREGVRERGNLLHKAERDGRPWQHDNNTTHLYGH